MAKIPMISGFKIIPEGTYIFNIYDVEEDEEFGIIKVHLVTQDGQTIVERYQLKNNDDEWNEGALRAFSYLCKIALDDMNRQETEPSELIGRYLRGGITHSEVESTKYPGKTNTYANLNDLEPAESFEGEPSDKTVKLMNKNKELNNSLNALLGD